MGSNQNFTHEKQNFKKLWKCVYENSSLRHL